MQMKYNQSVVEPVRCKETFVELDFVGFFCFIGEIFFKQWLNFMDGL